MMTDAGSILLDNEFFADTVDTPKESVEQYRKQECLKSALSKGKILGGKKQWTHERVDKPVTKLLTKFMLSISSAN